MKKEEKIKKLIEHLKDCPVFKDYGNEKYFENVQHSEEEKIKIIKNLEEIDKLLNELCLLTIAKVMENIKNEDEKFYKMINSILKEC